MLKNVMKNKHLQSVMKNNMIRGGIKNAKMGIMNAKIGAKMAPGSMAKIPGLYNDAYKKVAHNAIVKKVTAGSAFALGSVAMAGISVMNGGMAAAQQNMTNRYMQDSRYSSKLLQNRVGRSSGNGALNIGNHVGLSLSAHRGRHG